LGEESMPICCNMSATLADVMAPVFELSKTSKDSRMLRSRDCGR